MTKGKGGEAERSGAANERKLETLRGVKQEEAESLFIFVSRLFGLR